MLTLVGIGLVIVALVVFLILRKLMKEQDSEDPKDLIITPIILNKSWNKKRLFKNSFNFKKFSKRLFNWFLKKN